MLHLDYVSCLLTVLSTVLVGRRKWQGWVVAGANSAIISLIGLRTGQWGFVPANAFCIAIYFYNIRKWRSPAVYRRESHNPGASARLNQQGIPHSTAPLDKAISCRTTVKQTSDERLASHRIPKRRVPHQRESRTPF